LFCGFLDFLVEEYYVVWWCVLGKLEGPNVLILMEYIWKVGR
jgi:hypothetical protein